MKNLVLIDTSGWICFFSRRGHEDMKKVISTLLDEDRVAIAGPILVELSKGRETLKKNRILKTMQKVFTGFGSLTINGINQPNCFSTKKKRGYKFYYRCTDCGSIDGLSMHSLT